MGGGSFLKESQVALTVERKKISPCANLSFFPEFLGRSKMTGSNLPSSENTGGGGEERGLDRPS